MFFQDLKKNEKFFEIEFLLLSFLPKPLVVAAAEAPAVILIINRKGLNNLFPTAISFFSGIIGSHTCVDDVHAGIFLHTGSKNV